MGVDVLTAYEDGAERMEDAELMDRATELGRVLFSQDDDLLAEAVSRQRRGIPFSGVVYAHQMRISIGKCLHDLDIIAKAGEMEDLANRVQFLPM